MKKCFFILSFLLFIPLNAQNGLVKNYFSSGKLASEINFSKNLKDGPAKFYYENGKTKQECTYLNGRIDGAVKTYYENGNVKEIYTIVEGKREGTASYYGEDGKFIEDVTFKSGIKFIEPKYNEEDFKEEFETDSTVIVENAPQAPPAEVTEKKVDTAVVYSEFEIAPTPKYGADNLKKRLYYPTQAKNAKIEGTVKVEATIDEWGDVSKAEVVKGLGYGLDESARTLVYYTKFNPAMLKGIKVKSKIIFPVEFKLSEVEKK